MKKVLTRKIIVIGIIGLFVGTSIVSGVSVESGGKNLLNQINESASISSSTTDWWSMFHHDSSHSGYSTSTAPATNKILWSSVMDGGFGNSDVSSAVVDGKVYVCPGKLHARVYCLNAENGSTIWVQTISSGAGSPPQSPAVVDGKVYVGSDYLYCFNAINGTLIWDYEQGAGFGAPTVVDGKVFIGVSPGYIYCLNAITGSLIWSFNDPESWDYSRIAPAVVSGKVYFGYDTMYCLDADTGSKIWESDIGWLNNGLSSPAVVDGKVYIFSCDGIMYCFNADTGANIWNNTIGFDSYTYSSPAVSDGKVYVGSSDHKVYCLNANTGAKIWDYPTGDMIMCSSPAVANGKVYIGSLDAKFYCLDANTGAKIWSYTTTDVVQCSPAIANGKVYIFSDNIVYCFGGAGNQPSKPIINGPSNGEVGVAYNYSFVSSALNGGNVSYYIVWGDGTNTGWIGPYPSGEEIIVAHTWDILGLYRIRCKAKDVNNSESEWGILWVTMPYSYNIPFQLFWERLFQRFPNAFPILRHILGY